MRSTPRYPVDRYMVESSNKIEMVNIIDDELWNTEPALRPEDEIVLRKLHDMLQSTADDLKLLSSDLAKYHQPGVQIKTQPMPLDEDFNEKIHIEELVNAKFHGHKIIDKPTLTSKIEKFTNSVNTGVQVDVMRKPGVKKLEVTRTRFLDIDDDKNIIQSNKLNSSINNSKRVPTVAYNEFVYNQEESKVVQSTQNKFKIQDMPCINIRNELKPQKVLQLDIFPDSKATRGNTENNTNVAVVAIEHNMEVPKTNPKITLSNKQEQPATTSQETTSKSQLQNFIKNQPIRKVSKMSTLESSESGNNVSSDTMHSIQAQKQIKSIIRSSASPKHNIRDKIKNKKASVCKEPDKKTQSSINEWRTKLNDVYGQSLLSKTSKISAKQLKRSSLKKTNLSESSKQHKTSLNKAEYIPYSQLTLGGVRVSDIEKEISDISNKGDIPLSPVLDKILSSRENSFHKQRFFENNKDSPRILTTSDENLLKEVIDIERKVSKTIKKSMTLGSDKVEEETKVVSDSKEEEEEKNSYADDFEEENTENTNNSSSSRKLDLNQNDQKNHSTDSNIDTNRKNTFTEADAADLGRKPHNITYTKKSNLSLKNSVDVFEIVHSINTQDMATQSNVTHKISLKETQTSPRNEKPNIQPIHNDLWPADPKGEVEKMFKLEKDFIKKLIIDEYGEFFEKSFTKPSTSKAGSEHKQMNIAATQKITQTSPARVKSVMTSPTMTKTRTTSPFFSVKVDHQTSPLIVVTNEEQLTVEVGDDEDGISINLSSPRFSLRLPQTSREVLSNLEGASLSPLPPKTVENTEKNSKSKVKANKKSTISSSSSDVDNSTEISSLGEVKWKLKRRLRKKVSSISESSESSSSLSKYSSEHLTGSILPMRSEGEVSLGQLLKKVKNKPVTSSKSEGEASLRKTK